MNSTVVITVINTYTLTINKKILFYYVVISIKNIEQINFDSVPIDSFWNVGNKKELKMHRIHGYPAKFPAFITTKALDFVKQKGMRVSRIADIFCGCGTVSYEARRNNIDFWGCDINPIATMIAKVKCKKYSKLKLQNYFDIILKYYFQHNKIYHSYNNANPRIKYWYNKKNFNDLLKLKNSIKNCISKSSYYRPFFLCAFSNILKKTSFWLTKSIKPQIDPHKKPFDIISTFKEQVAFMINANDESDIKYGSSVKIVTNNFFDSSLIRPKVDMIITSPPYVTSYEYADLHQLSSLWLNISSDYRTLRKGSIGSIYNNYDFKNTVSKLNITGKNIVLSLFKKDKSKARSVSNYYYDMQKTSKYCYRMLSNNGFGLFIIGNTEYKGVRIENAKHLSESLFNSGFKTIYITKRKIKNKILTPYRDCFGRFSRNSNSRKVYSEEFIIIGRK